jgi:hypothetical protein
VLCRRVLGHQERASWNDQGPCDGASRDGSRAPAPTLLTRAQGEPADPYRCAGWPGAREGSPCGRARSRWAWSWLARRIRTCSKLFEVRVAVCQQGSRAPGRSLRMRRKYACLGEIFVGTPDARVCAQEPARCCSSPHSSPLETRKTHGARSRSCWTALRLAACGGESEPSGPGDPARGGDAVGRLVAPGARAPHARWQGLERKVYPTPWRRANLSVSYHL